MGVVSMYKDRLLALVKGIAPHYSATLYLVLVFALGMLLSSIMILPQEMRIHELERQVQAEQQKVTAVENFVLAHPNMDEYLSEIQRLQAKTEMMLPGQLDVSKFISQLETAARSSGVKLLNVKPAAVIDRSGYREMPVELSVEGSFYAVMSFIKKMEDGERFAIPTAFLIQPKQNLLVARLNLQIFAYGNPPRSAPAPAAAPAPAPAGLPVVPTAQ